ncbi:MAG: hypothetical protein RML99_12745 [Anaerolineae bacterium]|nr:hypothetical protein [Anaerolineae bacterium]
MRVANPLRYFVSGSETCAARDPACVRVTRRVIGFARFDPGKMLLCAAFGHAQSGHGLRVV